MKPTELKTTKIAPRLSQIDAPPQPLSLRSPLPRKLPELKSSPASRASSIGLVEIPGGVDAPPATGGSTRPNPVELPSPINPEGGRKQSVETHRNLFCNHYDSCLDEAVKHGWNSFTCVRCSFYQAVPEPVAVGVERFATQRKAS